MCSSKGGFEVFGPRITVLLKSVLFLNNFEFSLVKKISCICITGSLLFLSFLLIISELVDIKNSYDLATFAARIIPSCFHVVGALKWIFGIINVNNVEGLIKRMKQCHELCLAINESDKEFSRYNKKIVLYKNQTSTFAKVWFFMSICGVIQWCMNPVFYDLYNEIYMGIVMNSSASRHLPYPGVFPWDINSHSKYIGTFAFQLIGGIGCAVGHAIYETSIITLLASASLQLEYLNETLLDEIDNKFIIKNSGNINKFEKKLRNCVRHHIEILKFLEELINIASYPMFVVCVDCTMALCLVSYDVASMKIDKSIECIMKLMSTLEYWTAINLDLFVYCFMGTKIENLGLKIADSVYSCDWEASAASFNEKTDERVSKKIQQMVHFCMMRAQKPVLFTDGLFYVLSLPTFKALVGFALSNAIVLRQVSEEI